MLDRMTRWVQRTGRIVEYGNVVGPFVGRTYSYRFPSGKLAEEFERLVNGTANGLPNPVPPEWRRYQVGRGTEPRYP